MAKTNTRRTQKASDSQLAKRKSSRATKEKYKIGVFGAGGRMGREVLATIRDFFGESCFLAVDTDTQALIAKNIVADLKDPLCEQVQIWIDFSSPTGFSEIFQFCQKNKKPLVSGTTGLSVSQLKKMTTPKIPLLWSPNMSLGINLLLKALRSFHNAENFDFQIEELHHRNKKDKPSGTALLLQKELEMIVGKKCAPPVSIRGGGIFGIHKVWAMSEEEMLFFEHQALGRSVFAKGAVHAMVWLKKKKPGLYSLQNLLER